jgi:ferric-dicitrate binding protein FerR (iron transport regulator)
MKKDQTHIDQKLLVLYLLDEISQQGRLKVEAWLQASDANRNFFEELRKTWDTTGKIDPAAVAFDAGKAWEKLSGRIGEEVTGGEGSEDAKRVMNAGKQKILRMEKNVKNGKRVSINWGVRGALLAVAAVAVFVAASVVFVKFLRDRQDMSIITLALEVPVEDTLTDGSTVVLNTHSKLTAPKKFEDKTRQVELVGEAFFQVEPDAERPFIIEAGLGQVRVLGTSFQVKAYPGSDLEVYVETGLVELSAVDSMSGDTTRILLKAGERGMIRQGSKRIGKPALIGADELFWANKKLIFQETRLSLVFDLLRKHYEADIEVKDKAIMNCLLSATFTDESIDQILEVVAASFDLKMTLEQEKYIINGKGCGNGQE